MSRYKVFEVATEDALASTYIDLLFKSRPHLWLPLRQPSSLSPNFLYPKWDLASRFKGERELGFSTVPLWLLLAIFWGFRGSPCLLILLPSLPCLPSSPTPRYFLPLVQHFWLFFLHQHWLSFHHPPSSCEWFSQTFLFYLFPCFS